MNKLIVTEDGSHSLYNSALNETYHSFHGAIQESQHVFIASGLDYLKEKSLTTNNIRVLEVGFGTGLNVLMSAIWSFEEQQSIILDTLEAFPLDRALTQQLNYDKLVGHSEATKWFQLIHEMDWGTCTTIHEHFLMTKIHSFIENYNFHSQKYDVIFFDAFAPSKQPEMWSANMLKKVTERMNPGGIFVTYCAQGQLKRNLKSLGLKVETLPGPPGKKEMVRGIKK